MAFEDPGTGRNIMNSNVGPEAPTVTLAEACKRGDVLGYSSGWKMANADAATIIQGRLVALQGGAIGDVIPISQNPVVQYTLGATKLLTPGGYVYVADGDVFGLITQTMPDTTSGDAQTIIGIALSTTEVLFFLNSRVDATKT